MSGAESSLVLENKEKQYKDLILLELMENVRKKRIMPFFLTRRRWCFEVSS